MLHKDMAIVDGIHIVHSWSVADAAARLALAPAAADIGKVCYQQDTKVFYVLADATPTWKILTVTNSDDVAEGATNKYFTAAGVLGTVLAGLSTAAGTIVDATHTILQAIGFLQKQVSDLSITVGGNTGSINANTASINTINTTLTNKLKQILPIAVSDETTAIAAGTGKITFHMPFAMTVSEVIAGLTTAQTSGAIFTVDINEAGVSILSTKLTIDNTEETSLTAVTAPVISDSAIAKGAKITVDVDQIGDGTAKGLKVYLVGTIT